MEPGIEFTGAKINYLDSESGSAYELSSEAEQLSHDEEIRARSTSRTPKGKAGSQSGGWKRTKSQTREYDKRLLDEERPARSGRTSELDEGWIQDDALCFAANFEPPSPNDIRSPHKLPARSRVQVLNAKRKAVTTASEIKAKRLKGYHSKNYRKLMNTEIHDAATRSIAEDRILLLKKQIGSSIWSTEELDLFFTALSRLGRANVRKVARRIGSKSEFEVQVYIGLLQEKRGEVGADTTRQIRLLSLTDYPSAVEISEECIAALEKAGDKLAVDQERHEEEEEEAKWGDSWLITHNLTKEINREFRNDGKVKDFSPAAELLNPKIWIELSGRVFMNTATPQEDNWKALAEEGELPAIRATAFEDFHSLAVSITKRLVQTALHCTLSRQKARNINPGKQGDVNREDVDAAVAMLRLPANSKEFWLGCARRNKLAMIDDEQGSDSGDDVDLTYDEVEIALGNNPMSDVRARAQSRSPSQPSTRSRSGSQLGDKIAPEDPTDLETEEIYSSDDSFLSEGEDSGAEGELPSASARREDARQKRVEARRANERANAAYIEAYDAEADRLEEERLWGLLKQPPPSGIKHEPLELSDRPTRSKNETEDPGDWRAHIQYWSPWEKFPMIPEKVFAKNGEMMVEKARKRATKEERASQGLLASDSDMSEEEELVSSTVSASEGEEHQPGDGFLQEEEWMSDEAGSLSLLRSPTNDGIGNFYHHSGVIERSDDEMSFQGQDET